MKKSALAPHVINISSRRFTMEIIIIIALLVGCALIWTRYVKTEKSNTETAIDTWAPPKEMAAPEVEAKPEIASPKVEAEVASVKEVAKKTTARVKKALDVNQDGKVNAKDAVAAVKKVAAKTTKAKPKA